jgi:hypothetical protein
LQCLRERRDASLSFWIVRGQVHEHSDTPHPAILLRAGGKRPRCSRSAEQRDELPSFQLIGSHSVPCQPGPDCRISNWQGSVSGHPRCGGAYFFGAGHSV